MINSSANEEECFETWFKAITGFQCLRWQKRLFRLFVSGDLPSMLDLPTGLGKTSVMVIWLLARAFNPTLPRRLVYVVDRNVVVDQASQVATDCRYALEKMPELADLLLRLGLSDAKLPISTLRGQFADNSEWLANPVRPSIMVGTIDTIGSRLLFEGYGVSRGMRRYHAGFLGVDTLCILDEANLCSPFAALLKALSGNIHLQAQNAERRELIPVFKYLPLSAFGSNQNTEAFQLEFEDKQEAEVNKRFFAEKHLEVELAQASDDISELLANKAWELRGLNNRILIYCDRRETAKKIADNLKSRFKSPKMTKDYPVNLLVTAGRVKEREDLAEWLEMAGFIAGAKNNCDRPTFLIATAAGEVGIDLDADHMVCDLVSFERMVQRFGRVNRRGDGKALIFIICMPPKLPKENANLRKKPALIDLHSIFYAGWEVFRKLPITYLGKYDASSGGISALMANAVQDVSLAENIRKSSNWKPLKPELSRAVVDAWSMTSLEDHTGRPVIEPWLRGWLEKDEPETTVVWREFLPWRNTDEEPSAKEVNAFFAAAPIHLSESLLASTYEVVDVLIKRAEVCLQSKLEIQEISSTYPVAFILNSAGKFEHPEHCLTFDRLLNLEKYELRQLLGGKQIVVARFLGGLSAGLLNSDEDMPPITIDAGWPAAALKKTIGYRIELVDDSSKNQDGWRTVHSYPLHDEEAENSQCLQVQVYNGLNAQSLTDHHDWAGKEIDAISSNLGLPADYTQMLSAAMRQHDQGKDRNLWQNAMNAPKAGRPYAITNNSGNPRFLDGYRHEFGTLGDVGNDQALNRLPTALKELALHCIAAQHGYACPIIAPIDPNYPPSVLEERAQAAAIRFAKLQQQWGPWGLAWWEAVFRSVDKNTLRQADDQCMEMETP